jgi:hypothetical protein
MERRQRIADPGRAGADLCLLEATDQPIDGGGEIRVQPLQGIGERGESVAERSIHLATFEECFTNRIRERGHAGSVDPFTVQCLKDENPSCRLSRPFQLSPRRRAAKANGPVVAFQISKKIRSAT